MANELKNIKTAIKQNLDDLVTSHVLGYVKEDDFRPDILSEDYPAYPVAILTPPSTESNYDTSQTNNRVHSFEIIVAVKVENLTDNDAMVGLMQSIMDKFDYDPTLIGHGTIGTCVSTQPSASGVLVVGAPDKSLAVFVITLKASVFVNWK